MSIQSLQMLPSLTSYKFIEPNLYTENLNITEQINTIPKLDYILLDQSEHAKHLRNTRLISILGSHALNNLDTFHETFNMSVDLFFDEKRLNVNKSIVMQARGFINYSEALIDNVNNTLLEVERAYEYLKQDIPEEQLKLLSTKDLVYQAKIKLYKLDT